VAGASDRLGFTSVLVPFGMFCEDPWLVTAALARQTERLKFMVAFRPGLMSPTLAAQMAATAQRLSGGRLLINVVIGGDSDEQRRYGDWLDHDQRYARSEEFLAVMRGAWSGEPFDYDGDCYRVRGARVARPPVPVPEIYLGGSSYSARRAAAQYADVYLAWGEPPDRMAELVGQAREAAVAAGRQLRIGTRFHVISRDTADEAWAQAEALVSDLDPKMVQAAQGRFAKAESEGQRRAAQLHGGGLDRLEVYPNVWAGYGLVRPGAGVALVGSHDEVADRIGEYHALGLDDFILSGQPHVEEAYWVGEGVLPLLRERGLLGQGPGDSSSATGRTGRTAVLPAIRLSPAVGPAAGVTAPASGVPFAEVRTSAAAADRTLTATRTRSRQPRSRVVALVGTPWPQSRTRTLAAQTAAAIAMALARDATAENGVPVDLAGSDARPAGALVEMEEPSMVDLSELAPQLTWAASTPAISAAREMVVCAEILLVASSTIKASYSGVLKLFLDLLPRQALAGVVAVPLMTAGDPTHRYAVDFHLRPILDDLGALVPTPGLPLLRAAVRPQ